MHGVISVVLGDVLGPFLFAVEHQLVDHRAHRLFPHVMQPFIALVLPPCTHTLSKYFSYQE